MQVNFSQTQHRSFLLYISRKTSDKFCYPQGLEGEILKQESKKFNFKLSMTRFSGKNPWKQMMIEVNFCEVESTKCLSLLVLD